VPLSSSWHRIPRMTLKRVGIVLLGLLGVLTVTVLTGVQAGFLVLIGVGFGLCLQGFGFGFAGAWRRFIQAREAAGLVSHMLLIAVCAGLSLPLLALYPTELAGAVSPLSWSLLIGAFVFGLAMQVTDGCGSGSIHKAGAGNSYAWAVLPGFILGSVWGATHQSSWLALGGPLDPLTRGTPATVDLLGALGLPGALGLTLLLCGGVAAAVRRMAADPAAPLLGAKLVQAAVLLGLLYALHLVVAGQPWGVVYGLGLWGAKGMAAVGVDFSQDPFWGATPHADRLVQPVLWDITTLTNLGLLFGAMAAARWSATDNEHIPLGWKTLLVGITAGVVLGYSSRMAFGCNIGAFLGGAASASLHGWVWFVFAFFGSVVGVRLRAPLGVR